MGGRNLVDALPVAPLPVEHLAGADVTVAIDVTAAGGETGTTAPDARGPRVLQALGETIELVAAHASERERSLADVVIRNPGLRIMPDAVRLIPHQVAAEYESSLPEPHPPPGPWPGCKRNSGGSSYSSMGLPRRRHC